MDDLGISTPRLADLRQLLLERGVRGCVESGRWDQLEPGHALEGFAHQLVVRGDGDVMVGRIWSSRDGKGRAAYPMIACAQFRGVPLTDALQMGGAALQSLQQRCQAASAAGQVVDAVLSTQTSLRERAAAIDPARTELRLSGDVPGLLARQVELGPDRQGMHRVLYQMDRELAPFLRGPGGSRSRSGGREARHLRVPLAIDDRATALEAWMNLVYLRIEPWCPLMLIVPDDQRWIDVIVGDMAGPELFCLRASTNVMPMASQIPYTIDAQTVAGYDRFIDGAASGPRESLHADPRGPSDQSPVRGRTASGRNVIILALLLAVLLIGSLVFLIFGPRIRGAATPAAPPRQPAPGAASMAVPPPPWSTILAVAALGLATSGDEPAASDRLGADSPVLQSVWQSQRRLLRDIYGDAFAPEAIAHAERIRRALVSLAAIAPAPPEALAGPDAEIWAALARRKREQRLGQLLVRWNETLLEPQDDLVRAELAAVADELSMQARQIGVLADAVAKARADLDGGRAPAALAAMIDREPLMRDADLRPLVTPIIERVRRVAAIERMREVDALLDQLGSAALPERGTAKPEPEVIVAGWRRLGSLSRSVPVASIGAGTGPAGGRATTLWPATADDLHIDQRLADAVESIARSQAATDPQAAAALLGEVAAERARRARRLAATAEDGPSLAAAAVVLERLGVARGELEPRVQFNLLLSNLRRALSGELPDAEASAAARRFVDEARALPGGTAFIADAAATLRNIEEILAGVSPGPVAPPVPTQLGPAITGKYIGRVDGDRVIFIPMGGGRPLAFVLVESASPGSIPPFYLGQTEVSLGQFIDLAAAGGIALEKVIPFLDPAADGRLGPRVWEWRPVRGAAAELTPASEWLAVLDVNARAQYGPGENPGRPTPDHPMNYVAPYAAALVAAAVGCRLPTADEWSLAAASLPPEDEPAAYNLRDQTWLRHDLHVRRAIDRGLNVQAADAGSIGPTSGSPTSGDDGVLWFSMVSVGGGTGPVRHLRGNVAEWLLNTPTGAIPTTPGAEAVEAFVAANRDRFLVAGGSAITDPSADQAQPRVIDVAEAAAGYCDVGFRLAFSAQAAPPRAVSLAERLRTAVDAAPYLRPPTR